MAKRTMVYYMDVSGVLEEKLDSFLESEKSKMIKQLKTQYSNEFENGALGLIIVPLYGGRNELVILNVLDSPYPYGSFF